LRVQPAWTLKRKYRAILNLYEERRDRHSGYIKEERCAGHVAHIGVMRKCWSESLMERDNSENYGVDGRIVDWIHLAQDKDRWRGVVNTVMNLRVP
jgi:hypothetical protein